MVVSVCYNCHYILLLPLHHYLYNLFFWFELLSYNIRTYHHSIQLYLITICEASEGEII
jgi:hypothetical protein